MRACALWSEHDPLTGFLTRGLQLNTFAKKLNSALADERLIEEIKDWVAKFNKATSLEDEDLI